MGLACLSLQPISPPGSIATLGSRWGSLCGPRRPSASLVKEGFIKNPDSQQYTGEVTIGDIGVPCELLEEFGTVI